MQASYWATRLNAATDSAKRVLRRQRAVVGVQFVDDAGVLRRIGRDRDAGEVLRRRAQHRRAADVDVLDDVVEACCRDWPTPARTDTGSAPAGRSAAMPCSAITASSMPARPSRPPCTIGCRVLTRPSIISGKPVTSADVADRQAGVADRLGGAAGGQQFDAARGQGAGPVRPGRSCRTRTAARGGFSRECRAGDRQSCGEGGGEAANYSRRGRTARRVHATIRRARGSRRSAHASATAQARP